VDFQSIREAEKSSRSRYTSLHSLPAPVLEPHLISLVHHLAAFHAEPLPLSISLASKLIRRVSRRQVHSFQRINIGQASSSRRSVRKTLLTRYIRRSRKALSSCCLAIYQVIFRISTYAPQIPVHDIIKCTLSWHSSYVGSEALNSCDLPPQRTRVTFAVYGPDCPPRFFLHGRSNIVTQRLDPLSPSLAL